MTARRATNIGLLVTFVLLWLVLVVGTCRYVEGADYALPVTGTSRAHGLSWIAGSGRTTYFILESTPIFGPESWRRLGELPYTSTCTPFTTRGGAVISYCRFGAGDRTARYRVTPCNAAGCGGPTTESELLLCCRSGEFDLQCYANMLAPMDCK